MHMKVNITLFIKILFLLGLLGFFSNDMVGQSFPNGTQTLECCSCANGNCTLVADSDPMPFNSADNQVYLLVDVNNSAVDGDADNDAIVGMTSSGVFNGVPTGDYVMYYVSYNPSDAAQITPLFNNGTPIGDLLALGVFQGNGTWLSSDPSFVAIASDLALVNGLDCGCTEPAIMIADPCACSNPNNYLNSNVLFLAETVTVTGPPNGTWTLDLGASSGIFDANGNSETQALTMTEVSAGVYELNFFWNSMQGFNASFTSGEGLASQSIGQQGGICDCENSPCFDFDAIAQVICNPEKTEYNVLLIFDGGDAGSGGYNIVDDLTGSTFNNLPTNSINFGPFPTNTGYSYTINVADHPECNMTLSMTTVDCIVTSIELTSFTGDVLPEGNELTWDVASENNTDYYTLEYSINGLEFKEAGIVSGQGNSNISRNYVYLHEAKESGLYYYRLKETDLDGHTNVASDVVVLERVASGFSITNVYPIPTSDWINIDFISKNYAQLTVEVMDITGKVLQTESHTATSGNNQISINAEKFVAGTYFISISNGIETVLDKFVKN